MAKAKQQVFAGSPLRAKACGWQEDSKKTGFAEC